MDDRNEALEAILKEWPCPLEGLKAGHGWHGWLWLASQMACWRDLVDDRNEAHATMAGQSRPRPAIQRPKTDPKTDPKTNPQTDPKTDFNFLAFSYPETLKSASKNKKNEMLGQFFSCNGTGVY